MAIQIDLSGKVAVVTGGSSGIGLGCGVELGRAGADVLLQGRDEGRLADAVAQVRATGVRCESVAAELTDDAAPAALVAAAVEKLGGIDVLVHSAGIFEPTPFAEATLDSLDRQWAINVRAPFALTQAALPHLGKGSSVIFLTSIAGIRAFPSAAAYCATKGAAELMMKSLALELIGQGIRVNAVAPGNIKTAMNQPMRDQPGYEDWMNSLTPAGRFGEVAEIANAVCFLASDLAEYVVGASYLVDGGWIAK